MLLLLFVVILYLQIINMTNRFKIISALFFILFLLLGAHYAKAQTTTTTTTLSTVNTPNVPKIGDITSVTTNQIVTTSQTTELLSTGNLLSNNNFCTGGWTGTQITNSPAGNTSDLGCGYLTGKGSSSYAEKNIDLSTVITKQEQNYGFTQSASANTGFFWNWPQSLTMSHSVINKDTGETITQNRFLSKEYGSDTNYMSLKSIDNIIIGTNSSSGYTSQLRFDFSSTGSQNTWQGADITSPNLSITYTGLTTTTTSSIETITTVISCESLGTCYIPPPPLTEIKLTEEIKTTPYQNSITGEVYGMAPPTITNDISVNKTSTETVKMETQATNTALTGDPSKTEATTSTVKEESTTSTKESNATTITTTQETSTSSKTADTKSEQKSEEKQTTTTQSASNENKKTEGSQKETTSEKTVSDTKTTTNEKGAINVSVEAKVKAAVEKVERELKSIEDKTKAIQEIKLDGIKAGAPNLAVYENKSFYDVRQMVGVPNPDFYNQINIQQQQIYKDASLSAYINKDPIAVRQSLQMEIEEEINRLILEIEQLKRS